MAGNGTITSANSSFTITVPGLYNSPVQLQGYAADRAWESEGIEIGETPMGVDGHLSAGYTPQPVVQTIHLQADSPSIDLFDTIFNATKASREMYRLSGSITLPATGKAYSLTRGFLVNYKPLPDGAKTLQPVDFQIKWESINPTYV